VESIARERERLLSTLVAASDETNRALADLGAAPIRESVRALELLRRPELAYMDVLKLSRLDPILDIDSAAGLETDIKYEGYVKRQTAAIDRFARLEEARIPDSLDYSAVGGLSTEVRERLTRIRPRSLGQAARTPGVTPAAISILAVHLKSDRRDCSC
jgi:tRNA uridine 5-carboxymethylaminomethyl modification enzyme